MRVIATAEAGYRDADLALREEAAECINREMPTELANYARRALMRPPVRYPRGRNLVDTWTRDHGIYFLVLQTHSRWNVPVSRSHSRKRSAKEPLSACYLVALALNKGGYSIQERQVERIVGDFASAKTAKRLSASIPLFDPDDCRIIASTMIAGW